MPSRTQPCASLRAGLGAILLCAGCAFSATSAAPSHPPATAPAATRAPVEPALRSSTEPLPLLEVDGGETDLRNEAAQVTVVELWSVYCEPCIDRLPEYDAMRTRYANDPRVHFIAVNIDHSDEFIKAREILLERAPDLPAYLDPDGAVTEWLMPHDEAGRMVKILPLLAIVDERSRVHRRVNLDEDRTGFSFDEVVQLALESEMPPSMRNIHAQHIPSMPPARPGLRIGIIADATPEQRDAFIDKLEKIYRQDPDFSDEVIAERLADIRRRLEAGERSFEPNFSKDPSP